MKNNILCFTIATFIITTSCNNKIQSTNISQTRSDSSIHIKMKSDSLSKVGSLLKQEEFTLSVEPKRFNNSTMGKANLVLTNNSKEHILGGQAFYVDFYNNNIWERLNINENVVFDLIGYDIQPHSAREFEVNFKITPFYYKPGRYRILKGCVITSTKKRISVYDEFVVE